MLTVKDVAGILRLSKTLFYELCGRSLIVCYRCGLARAAIRIEEEALHAYVPVFSSASCDRRVHRAGVRPIGHASKRRTESLEGFVS
jgi:hypothetical protein